MPVTAVRPPSDRVLLVASAGAALGLALVTDQGAHRVWGVLAAAGYLAVAAGGAGRRSAPWIAGAVAGLVPMGALVLARASASGPGAPDAFAQPEVRLVEVAARRWLTTGSPWPSPGEAPGIDGYVPYLPGTAALGLPRALLGDVWWTDVRIVFALVTVACLVTAARLLRPGGAPGRWAAWLATGNPVVTLTVATGGHDLPMAGLLVLAFACASRWATVPWCAPAAGLALCTKPTAWPAVAVLAVLLGHRWGARVAARAGLAAAIVLISVCLPPGLRSGADVVATQLVAFPAGLADTPSPAGSPLPGGLLAALPHGRSAALVALAAAAVVIGARLLRRPPGDVATAARFAAGALTTAIALAPSSRVGWLVVPALLLAVPATISRHARPERVSVDAWVCSAASPRTPTPPPSRSRRSSGPTNSGGPS